MMRGQTKVRFLWRDGRPIAQLGPAVLRYFLERGFSSEKFPGGSGSGPFRLSTSSSIMNLDAECLEREWRASELSRVTFGVIAAGGLKWAGFHVSEQEDLPFRKERDRSAVYLLRMSFDGRLWASQGESTEEFQDLVRKYGQIKELWSLLGCDEVFAWDEYYLPNPDFLKRFPHHRDKLLRFANQGTQVLVRRIEERQQTAGYHWIEARIFIDPLDEPSLSAEEYRERWNEYLPGSLPKAFE